MFYILLIAYLLVGTFFAVLTTVVLDEEANDTLFGFVFILWPVAIVLAALCGLTYAIIWSATKLGTWIRNKLFERGK